MRTALSFISRFPAVAMAALIFRVHPVLAQTPTPQIVGAADAFLDTLTSEQRQKVVYAYEDQTQRARWSNFPTGFVPRGGLSLKQLSATQRSALMKLLAVVLSPMGLEKVNQIRQADDDFKANGSKRGPGSGNGPPPGGFGAPPPQNSGAGGPGGPGPGGPRGPGRRVPFNAGDMFGSDLYYISFLGAPSDKTPWMMQFGGHHLALNITFGTRPGVLTPTLTGAQPAQFSVNGKLLRPLGRESDKALALLQSLAAQQRVQAVLNYTVPDLVLGPGQDGKTIVPEGIKGSALNSQQQSMPLGLIAEWVNILNADSAAGRMAQIKADLGQTWFAWSGPTTGTAGQNISAYYRIQGPHLVIEYAPQHDEPTNHVHTIYRDPTNDYGVPTDHH